MKRTRIREGSNWDPALTAKPLTWPGMTREEESKFLPKGKTINRNDRDGFFYETGSDGTTPFVREAWERASEGRRIMKFES